MATKESELAKAVLGVLIAVGAVLLVLGCVVLIKAGIAWHQQGFGVASGMLSLAAQLMLAPVVAFTLGLVLSKPAAEDPPELGQPESEPDKPEGKTE